MMPDISQARHSFLVLFISAMSLMSCQDKNLITVDGIHQIVDAWHEAATNADFDAYFKVLDEHSIFIGTDAHERWTKSEFQEYSKPYFDQGEAWDFKVKSRHVEFAKDGKVVYFDELLDTWMGICRGSGILELSDGEWKIVLYHLSITVPNDLIQDYLILLETHNAE